MTTLTPEQYAWLTQGIQPNRVQNLKGQSHLEAWDVRRTLIRIFGFGGFDIETKALDLVTEMRLTHDKTGKALPEGNPRWTVVYRAEVRLTIKASGKVLAVFEDGASGDSQNQPTLGDAHDHAMKTALSQALKRCAVNLGDQFGLSLYNGGSRQPVVLRSLIAPEGAEQAAPAQPPPDEAPVQPEPQPQPEEPAEVSGPTPQQAAEFDQLAKLVAAAESEDSLRAVWEALVEAYKQDHITTTQANELKAAIGDRRGELAAEQREPEAVAA